MVVEILLKVLQAYLPFFKLGIFIAIELEKSNHMKLILSLLLIYTFLNAKITPYFSLIVHKPFNAGLFDITEDYDRSISAVGFSKEFTQASHTSRTYTNAFDYLASVSRKHGSQMTLLKVDTQAKILLSKVAKLSQFNKAVSIIKTPTNGYFIGGYTLDGSLLVAKLNENGNIIYTKTFGTKNYDKMNALIKLKDGGLLAVGSSFTSRDAQDNIFQTGLGNNDIFITKFTKNGQILWSKKYGTQYDDKGIDAAQAEDGSIIILSSTTSEQTQDVSFMRLTENGDKLRLNNFITHAKDKNLVIPKKIIKLRDNTFLVSLIEYNQVKKEHIRLVKIDLHTDILLDKNIETTYPSGLNDIKEFSNGTLMGVGYVRDKENTDGLAMLLDSHLSMLKQEHYGDKSYDVFNALTILHNSKVAVAGIHTDDDAQEGNMWIVKLNHDATLTQLSTQSSNFYTVLCKLFDKEIKNKTVTIKEDLTIEFSKEALYFQVGKCALNTQQKEFLAQFNKKLLNFLYANRENISALEINGHTSSEWKNANFTDKYLNNENLSMKRSFSVIEAMFRSQSSAMQHWLSKVIKGSGLSFSKKVVLNNIEDKKKSRSVTFKIILK